jgi:molybdopterin converting factor subunit 1
MNRLWNILKEANRNDSMPKIEIKYFAGIRERLNRDSETLETHASTPREVWKELCERESLDIDESVIRAAVNEEFGDWEAPLQDGDILVFIPPVAGG